jgi:hypothetical protein
MLVPAVILAARRCPLALALVVQACVFGALITLGAVVGPLWGDLVPAVRLLAPLQLALGAAAGMAFVELARIALEGSLALPKALRVVTTVALVGAVALLALSAPRVAGARVKTLDDIPGMHPAELDELLFVFAKLPKGRVVSLSGATASHWYNSLPYVHAEQPALRAYGGAALQSSANYIYLMQFPVCEHGKLYGARWLLVDRKQEGVCSQARLVHRTEHFSLLELPGGNLFEPVQVVGSLRAERNVHRYDAFKWLQSGAPERAEHLTVGDDDGARLPPRGRVIGESSGPSRYAAAVSTEGPGPTTFMLKVTWHPGWSATIDGAPAPVRRVSPDFLAIDVPLGEHRVRFVFARPAWTWALLWADLALVLGLVGWSVWRKRALVPLSESVLQPQGGLA